MDLARIAHFIKSKPFKGEHLKQTRTGQTIASSSFSDTRKRDSISLADLPGFDHSSWSTPTSCYIRDAKDRNILMAVWRSRAKNRMGQYGLNEREPDAKIPYPHIGHKNTTLYFDSIESLATYLKLKGIS